MSVRSLAYRAALAPVFEYYLFIYLFAQAHTLRTIRQGLEQDSKAQACTDSYPKITENPTQYKSKVKSK